MALRYIQKLFKYNDKDKTALKVLSVNFYNETNHNEHNTKYFYETNKALVVRRGQIFRIRLHFNRSFDLQTDIVKFVFTVANELKSSEENGTLVELRSDEVYSNNPLEWFADFEIDEEDSALVLIQPSITCAVMKWSLQIDTILIEGETKSIILSKPIYILFNPWCSNDQVFLSDLNQLKEFVLNDTTIIWRGTHNHPKASVWQLGQFEKNILKYSFELLDNVGKLSSASRGDPIQVSRALSAAVNSVDDNGVLLGNWGEDFSDGTPPTKWMGSPEILEKYYQSGNPVKYGQCWNFAGVLTTIARALGIPSRIVTCYGSSHDSEGSLTIDIFVDVDNKTMKTETMDSIWNYHVWNELWMKRLDLGISENGENYDGWQVLDATPQITSSKMFCIGPASVLAIKYGEILQPFDSDFVFSEVNADIVYWRYNGPLRPIKMIEKNSSATGYLIITKSILKWEAEDITVTYKYKDESPEERMIMLKALKQSPHIYSQYYLNENFSQVKFRMNLQHNVQIGQNFTISLDILNQSEEIVHEITGQINCDTVVYTGISGTEVKTMTFDVEIQPQATVTVNMEVQFSEYFNNSKSQDSFKISCSATIKNTDFEYFVQDDFRLRKPDIKFSIGGIMVAKKAVRITVYVVNPLPIILKKGIFHITSSGMKNMLRVKVGEVPVAGTASCTFKYIPPKVGHGTLLAKFFCKELDDIDGYIDYRVRPQFYSNIIS